jgi:hypothetical protein
VTRYWNHTGTTDTITTFRSLSKRRLGKFNTSSVADNMPEWLRGWPAKPLGSACAGSNPAVVVFVNPEIVI